MIRIDQILAGSPLLKKDYVIVNIFEGIEGQELKKYSLTWPEVREKNRQLEALRAPERYVMYNEEKHGIITPK